MKKTQVLTSLFFAVIAVVMIAELPAAAPLTFHVATNGSDKAAGDLAGPFATIEHARDAVRALRQRQGGAVKQPVTVYVHGGVYPLAAPLRLGPEDSGSADCPVTYAAFHDEKPVLSGGRALGGWKETTIDGKQLWALELPLVREGKWYFRELWISGQRRQRARHPHSGTFRVSGLPDLDLKQQYQVGQERFQYAPGEIASWKNREDVELVFLTFWISSRRGIAKLDEANHLVTLDHRSAMRLTDGFGRDPKLARYYVENAFELLDAPGEWYLDRKTGVLYYMPLPGEQIASTAAIAPVLDQLLLMEGEPEKGRNVEYLILRGLTLAHSGWWLPAEGPIGRYEGQAAAAVPGAVQLYGAQHVSFEHCAITHVSSYGIHFSRGCHHDRMLGCELSDLGTGGIKIGEPDRLGNIPPPGKRSPFPDDPKLETHHIEIADNVVRQGGRMLHQGHGVWVGQSYDNLIAHNHIYDLYQSGISVGWTWGYGKSLARGNVIEYNHIHQIGQRFSSDLGAIYTLGGQPGTVIRNNLIHDVQCADYVGRGIYLDEGSADIVVEKNLIYRTSTGGFGLNYGRRNTIRNNIFALGELSQIELVGNMSKAPPGNSYLLERNIFYWKPGQNVVRGPWRPKPSDQLVLRHNLYWQEGGGEVHFGSRTWQQWQGLGMDSGSIVADPLFASAEKGDFRLKPGSPALKLGFQRIDLSTVGPRVPPGPAGDVVSIPAVESHFTNAELSQEHHRTISPAWTGP